MVIHKNEVKETRKPLVYVVDDEAMVLKAVTQSIAAIDCNVLSFEKASDCIQAHSKRKCDLIVSDINMPEMDGLQLLQNIKAKTPETAVLIITGFGDVPLAVEALKMGASDFVEKPLDEETFLPKVKAILSKIVHREELPLTEAERNILKLVAEGNSNKEIAYLIGRSIRTVENHRHRLMRKLKIGSQAELVKLALQHGLIKIKQLG